MDPRLDTGLVVDVVLDGGWRRHMAVGGEEAGGLLLTAVGEPLALPGQQRWVPASLEWRAAGGAARIDGILHLSGDHLRLLPVTEPLQVQRRRHVRVPAELVAALVADEHRTLARTVDVSVGGMLLAGATELPVGGQVGFSLDLEGATVSGGGRIVRGTPGGERAVAFDGLRSGERALSRFVAECQRRRLARA